MGGGLEPLSILTKVLMGLVINGEHGDACFGLNCEWLCTHNVTQPENFRSSAWGSAIRSTESVRKLLYQNQVLRADFFVFLS